MKIRFAYLALVILSLGLLARNAWAATYIWNVLVMSGVWNATNWGGTPTISDTAIIDNGDTAAVPTGVSGTADFLEVGGTTAAGGTLNITGGSVTGGYGYLGYSAGSNGTAMVSSGIWSNTNAMAVGDFGTGALTINGGTVTDANGYIGNAGGSNGTATVTSGTWSSSNGLYVGSSGTGALTINGGTVQDSIGYIGKNGPAYGSVTVTSGTWSNSSLLYVGYSGTGALTINGGTVTDPTAYIGYEAGSIGTATVTSGTWTNSTAMYVGYSGTGTLTITGGVVSVNGGAGTLMLAESAGLAILNLGNGGSAGTLSAAIVTGGTGTAVVNFDQNGLYTFAPSLTGSLSVNAIGTGTTTLSSGSSSYTGATTVTAGTLIASGSLTGTVSTSVAAGAILEIDGLLNTSATNTVNGTIQGTGTAGAIVAHGGVIAPGLTTANASTATGILAAKGAVTLSSTTSFNIRLGLSASGTDCDELLVNSGSVNLAGANLQLAVDMAHIDPPKSGVPTSYAIIVGGASLTGSNSNVFGSYDGTAIVNNSFETAGGLDFNILYAANANGSGVGTGQDVVLEETAIPEPEPRGLVVSAAGLLILFRRRV